MDMLCFITHIQAFYLKYTYLVTYSGGYASIMMVLNTFSKVKMHEENDYKI